MRRSPIPNVGRKVRRYPLKTGETPEAGSFVLLDGTPEIVECGADPAAVLGIILHEGTAALREIETGYAYVAVAQTGRSFLLEGDDDPVLANINVQYGVAVDGDGIWYVDGTETTALVVEVVAVDLDRLLYEVEIISTVAQLTS